MALKSVGTHRPGSWFFAQLGIVAGDDVFSQKIVDTICFKEGIPESWLHSSSTDEVKKKKSLNVDAVVSSFKRSALHDPNNLQKYCGAIRFKNGTYRVLTEPDFDGFMATYGSNLSTVDCLQGYTHPKGGDGTVFRNFYQVSGEVDGGKILTATERRPKHLTTASTVEITEASVKSSLESLNEDLDRMSVDILRHVETVSGSRVVDAQLEYIIDEQDRIRLQWVAKCVTVPKSMVHRRGDVVRGVGIAPDVTMESSFTTGGIMGSSTIARLEGRPREDSMHGLDKKSPSMGLSSLGSVSSAHSSMSGSGAVPGWVSAKEKMMEREVHAADMLEHQRRQLLELEGKSVGDGWRGKVLICDNDAIGAMTAINALVHEGYIVAIATDGPLALTMIRDTKYDVLLIGRDLPSVSGMEVTRLIRHREESVGATASALGKGSGFMHSRLPIIAFTDMTEPDDLRVYMEAGMDGCICKPVEIGSLIGTVAAAVPNLEDAPASAKHSGFVVPTLETKEFERGSGSHAVSPITDKSTRRTLSPLHAKPVSGEPYSTKARLIKSPLKSRSLTLTKHSGTDKLKGEESMHLGKAAKIIPPPLNSTLSLPIVEADDIKVGVFQMDAETAIPYAVIGRAMDKAPLFHFVVCQDIFDTYETHQIFFRKITSKFMGLQVLVWNYPGQAFSEWRRDAILNNEYLAGCLQALLGHVGMHGTREFELLDGTLPFYLMGIGSGGAIASYFSITYMSRHANLRALLLVNGFSYTDAHLAGVLHDCINVFGCSPISRPDLPVYFFSRFLFSPAYLAKVGAPLALNLYTAVHNPISLEGRIQLCHGALAHVDIRDQLEDMHLPLILVASSRDGFVKSHHVQSFVDARGGEERSIKKVLKLRKKVCIIWLRSGHEVLQEARNPMRNLVEQLVTGFHEVTDASILPMVPDMPYQSEGSRALAAKPSLSKRVIDRARERADVMGKELDAHQEDLLLSGIGEGLHPGMAPGEAKVYEDRFIDNVIVSLKEGRDTVVGLSSIHGARDEGKGKFVSDLERLRDRALHGKASDRIIETTKEYQPPAGVDLLEGPYPDILDMEAPMPPDLGAPVALDSFDAHMAKRGKSLGKIGSKEDESVVKARMNIDPEKQIFSKRDMKHASPVPTHVPEIREYMAWRIRRNRKRLERLEACVRKIQSCWRTYLARTMMERMRLQKASVKIESWWRGRLGAFAANRRRREIWAARVIQRYWRGYLGRGVAWRMVAEERAARLIQRTYRGYRTRKFVGALRFARRSAAIRIQSMYRRRLAQRQAWILRERTNAAINIQRVWRGRLGRAKSIRERERFLFSKSQSQGIEFGRQMLMEHKLHGTRLQSEVTIITKEKLMTEEEIEKILSEISSFEEGVRSLEREMIELSRAEIEAAGALDDASKIELRDNKIRLDREFGAMLVKIADRREKLQTMERKLQSLDKTRQAKKEELLDLERKLVVLLEQQQTELASIKARQAKKGELLIEDTISSVTKALGGGMLPSAKGPAVAALDGVRHLAITDGGSSGSLEMVASSGSGGPTMAQRAEAASLMSSTETMMKFGFMSMSLTYFASMNMVRSMRQVGAANTILANPLLAGGPLAAMIGMAADRTGDGMSSKDAALSATKTGFMGLSSSQLGATSDTFRPALHPGEGLRAGSLDVRLWTVADVSTWLETISLGQYKDAFADAAIDGSFMCELNDDDLRSTLCIEHALHRKKIINCVRKLRDSSVRESPKRGASTMMGDMGSYIDTRGLDTSSIGGDEMDSHMDARSAKGDVRMAGRTRGSASIKGGYDDDGKEGGESIGGINLDEMMSWVRHSKVQKLSDALKKLPDRKFDPSNVRVQFVPDFGTQYIDALSGPAFHINKADSHGNSLLMVAGQNGSAKICQLLIRKGANPNHQNNQGQVTMHYCMAYEYVDLGQWLASPDGGGCDDTITNMFGLTPYDGLSE